MFLIGLILIVLGLFGVARSFTLPLGVILAVCGAMIDVIYLFFHSLALIF